MSQELLTEYLMLNTFLHHIYSIEQITLSMVHIFSLKNRFEIPEMTKSAQGGDCPECRLALLKIGVAGQTDMTYCKVRNTCITLQQHRTSTCNLLTHKISKLQNTC
jgi:hypothetical protein